MSFLNIPEVENVMNEARLDILRGVPCTVLVPKYAFKLEQRVNVNWISRVMRVALGDLFGKKCRQLDACMPQKYKRLKKLKSAAEVLPKEIKGPVVEPTPYPNIFRAILDRESPYSHWWS